MSRSSVKPILGALWDAFLPNNVVLVQALGICPILAVGYDLKYGVALSVCTAVVLLPASLFQSFVSPRLPNWLRPMLYTLLSSALLFAAALVLQQYVSPEIYAHLYVFLPLMAVNTLFTYRGGAARSTRPPLVDLADTLGAALGFALVLCVASALREIAINSSVWGVSLGFETYFPEAKHPFVGYVLLGFMAAGLQWVKQLVGRVRARKEAAR